MTEKFYRPGFVSEAAKENRRARKHLLEIIPDNFRRRKQFMRSLRRSGMYFDGMTQSPPTLTSGHFPFSAPKEVLFPTTTKRK